MPIETLSPKQARSIRESTARINIWHGSVRSGKSVASMIRWAASLLEPKADGGDDAIGGKTGRTVKRNVIGPLRELFGDDAVDYSEGAGEARVLGCPVLVFGANDERAEERIRGGTFRKVLGDELTLWPESLFRQCRNRMSPRDAQFFGSTNPDAPLHWLKAGFLDRAGQVDEDGREINLRSWHFSLHDNPGLTGEYIADLMAENTGLWRKRFVDGLWVQAEGAIWDAFDSDLQVIDEIPDGVAIRAAWIGLDYGTSAPLVALKLGDGSDGKIYVLDEWRWSSVEKGRQLSDVQYSEKLRAWDAWHPWRADTWYCDPSAASFVVQLRHDRIPALSANNDVGDGLRTVAARFAGDEIRILRRCGSLIACVQSYAWNPKAQARGIDEPLKVDDHDADALRYGIHSRGKVANAGLLEWAARQRASA